MIVFRLISVLFQSFSENRERRILLIYSVRPVKSIPKHTRVVWEGKIIAKLIDECECKICDLKRVNIMLYYTEKLLFHNSVLFLECIGGLILENLCLIHYTNR